MCHLGPRRALLHHSYVLCPDEIAAENLIEGRTAWLYYIALGYGLSELYELNRDK